MDLAKYSKEFHENNSTKPESWHDWLEKVDEIKKSKSPFYYSNNFLGSPKYENGILNLYEKGMTPQEALDWWKAYKGK